jgi:hypothetical protein
MRCARAEAVAQFAAEHYALSPPLNCRMLNRGFNDVYLVVTATSERFVFRLSHHRARGAADDFSWIPGASDADSLHAEAVRV